MDFPIGSKTADERTNHYDSPFLGVAAVDAEAMAAAIGATGMTSSHCQALVRSTGGLLAKLGNRRRYAALDCFFEVFLGVAKGR